MGLDQPHIITDSQDVLWLSTIYPNADMARDQIEADVNAGIAAPLTLKIVPMRTASFVRGDHHPRQRADTGT
jgi:hypothetical protein